MFRSMFRPVFRPMFRPMFGSESDLRTAVIQALFGADTYTNNGSTEFDTLFTHTRSGLATQYDSAGVLKWCPHNLFAESEDFSGSTWNVAFSAGSVTTDIGDGPGSNTNADRLAGNGSNATVRIEKSTFSVAGDQIVQAVWAKAGTENYLRITLDGLVGATETDAWFDLSAGTATANGTISDAGNGWYKCSINPSLSTDKTGNFRYQIVPGLNETSYSTAGDADGKSVFLWGAHLYRSDLGGMANNPDRGDSYVPTTSSAVYLPRRNAHWYDGAEWKKGIQIETEARTNLLLNSETPATQSVTVTDATTYTLWVEGSGSAEITAGGSGTATDGTHLTFTSTATTVEVTVTGSLDRFQLEQGPTPSSYISTAGSSVTRAADTIKVPSGQTAYSSEAMSFAMKGVCTYADNNDAAEAVLFEWDDSSSDRIFVRLLTNSTATGRFGFFQTAGGVADSVFGAIDALSPGVNVPFSIASRHTSSDINGAVDGTALTADTTPTALPDLSATDLDLAQDFMGILTEFKMWDRGLTDEELESETA